MNSYERYQEARRLMKSGHYDAAAQLFEANIKESPHFKDLELLGECLLHLDRFVDAIVPLAAATTLNKGVKAPALLAEVYYQLGEAQDAAAMAAFALQRDPNHRKALNIKAKLAKIDVG